MDGLGTEGAAASLVWHAINEVRKVLRGDVRGKDLDRLEKKLDTLTNKMEDLRVDVAKLNGG